MKVCVVGIGYVGLVTAGCLAEAGNVVTCVDNDAAKIERLRNGEIPIYEPGLTEIVKHNEKLKRLHFTTDLKKGLDESLVVFLAVGTPSSPDGSADMSAMRSVAEEIGGLLAEYRIIVTKSTVPVGTHKEISEIIKSKTAVPFDYVSNPEFLKEGSAVEDFMKPDRIIIGSTNPAVGEIMKQLYSPFMRKNNRILFMDPMSAEMTKYAANTMLATRISFINEMSELCEKIGADIEMVRRGLGSDSRIGSAFLFPGVGFGGSCFPKDVRALIHTGEQHSVEMTIPRAVRDVNLRQQQRFAQRILDYYKGKEDSTTLAVWGLAFKAKTDDVRESPAVFCVQTLLDAGFKIKAYDPEARCPELEARMTSCSVGYDALDGADGLVVLTDWQEFRNPEFDQIRDRLRRPIIFDGRNLYDPQRVTNEGFEYYSVGRK